MRQPGRKSSAALSVIVPGEFGKRPEPPDYLSARQAEIWRETVASEPIEFFNTGALRALLADYCRHRETAENLSSLIDRFEHDWLKDGDGVKRYQELLKMRGTETTWAMRIARSLRLTNQSRYNAITAYSVSSKASKGRKPWEA